jgi:hypothetical protein
MDLNGVDVRCGDCAGSDMEEMRCAIVSAMLLLVVFSFPLKAQQPFYTDDAEVSEKGDIRLELENEFDLLQHSASPALKQNTLVYRLGYGLTRRIELGVDAPMIAIRNVSSVKDAFGPGDTNFAVKYKISDEHGESRVPAIALRMNVEVPTGSSEKQLGSGLMDYWLYGVVEKT